MEVIEKQVSDTYVQKWEELRKDITDCYSKRDKRAIELMKSAISMYEELVQSGGTTVDSVTGEEMFVLLPLNGDERLAFIKEKIATPYSLIQLHALFTETIKKAARLRSSSKSGGTLNWGAQPKVRTSCPNGCMTYIV